MDKLIYLSFEQVPQQAGVGHAFVLGHMTERDVLFGTEARLDFDVSGHVLSGLLVGKRAVGGADEAPGHVGAQILAAHGAIGCGLDVKAALGRHLPGTGAPLADQCRRHADLLGKLDACNAVVEVVVKRHDDSDYRNAIGVSIAFRESVNKIFPA